MAATSRRRAAPVRINFQTVINAGLMSFAQQGFHGTSMRDIAAAAGTSLSNLYNYVPSKTDLLAQVLQTTAGDLLEKLQAAAARATDPVSGLELLVSAYIDFIVDQPEASVIGISEIRYLEGEGRGAVVSVRDNVERLFIETVTKGVESGVFRTVYPRDAARAVIGLCTALSGWYTPGGRLGREELATRYTGFALGLVGADQASGGGVDPTA